MSQLIADLAKGGSPLANVPGIQSILQSYKQNQGNNSGGNFFGGSSQYSSGAPQSPQAPGSVNPYDVVSQRQA